MNKEYTVTNDRMARITTFYALRHAADAVTLREISPDKRCLLPCGARRHSALTMSVQKRKRGVAEIAGFIVQRA